MKLILLTLASVFFICGEAHRGRIVGGEDVEIEDYPYQVSIQYNGKHFCGGSIYKPNVIITAAHCVFGAQVENLNIRAGSNNRENGGIVIKAKKIIPHKDWNSQTINNDIAILILSQNLQYSNNIKAIELAKEEPKQGQLSDVSGWGLLKEGGTESPKILQAISIPIWERNDCNPLVKNYLTENMFCAGVQYAGKSSCQMDSGGPLVVNGKLAGIVSWGIGCGQANSPSVFTNVSKYLKWVELNLN